MGRNSQFLFSALHSVGLHSSSCCGYCRFVVVFPFLQPESRDRSARSHPRFNGLVAFRAFFSSADFRRSHLLLLRVHPLRGFQGNADTPMSKRGSRRSTEEKTLFGLPTRDEFALFMRTIVCPMEAAVSGVEASTLNHHMNPRLTLASVSKKRTFVVKSSEFPNGLL